jgi:hypothetical protein
VEVNERRTAVSKSIVEDLDSANRSILIAIDVIETQGTTDHEAITRLHDALIRILTAKAKYEEESRNG